MRAFTGQDDPHRLEEDKGIQDQRVVLHVIQIVLELLQGVLDAGAFLYRDQALARGHDRLYRLIEIGLEAQVAIGDDPHHFPGLVEHRQFGDPETVTRINQYELAYRMQLTVPDVMDIGRESAATLEAYGAKPGEASFANNCLLARRLVEKGVRFVQVTTSPGQPWDHHSRIKQDMHKIATECDQGSAALVQDLKSRGLLDSTIVMWAGEFGRLPTTQNGDGRDHNRNAFTIWFAGGGFKKGLIYGETDDFGYKAVVNRVPVPDMIGTVLHQLGLDHKKIVYPYGGRLENPSDATVTGAKVNTDLIA